MVIAYFTSQHSAQDFLLYDVVSSILYSNEWRGPIGAESFLAGEEFSQREFLESSDGNNSIPDVCIIWLPTLITDCPWLERLRLALAKHSPAALLVWVTWDPAFAVPVEYAHLNRPQDNSFVINICFKEGWRHYFPDGTQTRGSEESFFRNFLASSSPNVENFLEWFMKILG